MKCPECGWSEHEQEEKWYPYNTKVWYEKLCCCKCGYTFWAECWKVRSYDGGSAYETIREVADTSIIMGLKRRFGDTMPSRDELRGYWLR